MSTDGGRLYVVGDLHGCPDELDALLRTLSLDARDTIVFIGDYVDRGPAPRDVVERLIALQAEAARTVFLKGNHEDMFLGFLRQPELYRDVFLLNGGGTTLDGYGLRPHGDATEASAPLPEAHRRFFDGICLSHQEGRFLFVHAGVDPSRRWEEQRPEDLLWIREEFFENPHPLPLTIVFGHTPFREVLVDLPYKIGLDTGLVYGNKLSCLELSERRLLQVRRRSREVSCTPLDLPLPPVAAE